MAWVWAGMRTLTAHDQGRQVEGGRCTGRDEDVEGEAGTQGEGGSRAGRWGGGGGGEVEG